MRIFICKYDIYLVNGSLLNVIFNRLNFNKLDVRFLTQIKKHFMKNKKFNLNCMVRFVGFTVVKISYCSYCDENCDYINRIRGSSHEK